MTSIEAQSSHLVRKAIRRSTLTADFEGTAKEPQHEETQDDEFANLMRKTRQILNAVVAQNTSNLTTSLVSLLASAPPEHVVAILHEIFLVGIDQPGFAGQYAEMLKLLMDGLPTLFTEEAVLQLCEEQHLLLWHDATPAKKQRLRLRQACDEMKIPIANEICVLVCDFARSDRMSTVKARDRFIGMQCLLGEFCRHKIIQKPWFCHRFVERVLRLRDVQWFDGPILPLEIEGVCKMLRVSGAVLEEEYGLAEKLTLYFETLNKETKPMNMRMRFMFRDMVDLRTRKWAPLIPEEDIPQARKSRRRGKRG